MITYGYQNNHSNFIDCCKQGPDSRANENFIPEVQKRVPIGIYMFLALVIWYYPYFAHFCISNIFVHIVSIPGLTCTYFVFLIFRHFLSFLCRCWPLTVYFLTEVVELKPAIFILVNARIIAMIVGILLMHRRKKHSAVLHTVLAGS